MDSACTATHNVIYLLYIVNILGFTESTIKKRFLITHSFAEHSENTLHYEEWRLMGCYAVWLL
jgi:hypothetical protein